MAGMSLTLYRNYSESDATYDESRMVGDILPTIEDIGWEPPSGKRFKEWNTERDGSGNYSFQPGDEQWLCEVLCAIWEDSTIDYLTTNQEITSIANAIRLKGGTSSPLVYPAGFVSAIEAIPTGGGNLQAKTNINPTTSSQTITPDTGYDGLSSVQINAMPSGSATTPATTITANPTISVSNSGLITATNSKTQSVTPTVSAGYVSSGTAGTITVNGSNTSQLTIKAAQTITPTTTDQIIASGKYLTGAQTIKGDANLVAGNIKSGTSIFGVVGTYSGGGGSNVKHSIFEWDDNYGCFVYSSGDIITRNEFISLGCSAVGVAIDEHYYYYYIAYFDGDPLVCVSDLRNQSVTMCDEDYSEDNNGMLLSEAGLPFANGVIHIFVY